MRKSVSALTAAALIGIGATPSSAMPMAPAGVVELAIPRARTVADIPYYPRYGYYQPYYFRPYDYYGYVRPFTYFNYYQTYGCYSSSEYCLYYW